MFNKSNLNLWIFCVYFIFYKEGAKLDDENRPYEFGFTIDGQQHRHERKDANGIIQGEFGFITADGVYHVTAYATDENGRFKILSMRNIKLSGPLDGSQAGSYSMKPLSVSQSISSSTMAPISINQNVGFTASTSIPRPATIENVQNVQVASFGEVTQRPGVIEKIGGGGVISTTKKPFVFTTQPTVKPACAGCGYVTKASSTTPRSGSTLNYDEINVQSKPGVLTIHPSNIQANIPTIQNSQGIQSIPGLPSSGGISQTNLQDVTINRKHQGQVNLIPNTFENQNINAQSIDTQSGSVPSVRPTQNNLNVPNRYPNQKQNGIGTQINLSDHELNVPITVANQGSQNIPHDFANQGIPNQSTSIQNIPNENIPTQGISSPNNLNQGVLDQSGPTQNIPNKSIPSEGVPNQGTSFQSIQSQTIPSQGISSQNNLNQETLHQSQSPSKFPNAPTQSILNQRIPNQNIPSQSGQIQNIPDQIISNQGFPNQGTSIQSVQSQTIPSQGISSQNNLNQEILHQSQGPSKVPNAPTQSILNQIIPNQNIPSQSGPTQHISNQNIQGFPNQGAAIQSVQSQTIPSQGISSQNNLNEKIPNQSQGHFQGPNDPSQSILNQRIPNQNIPSQSGPTQSISNQSILSQGLPNQGTSIQSVQSQTIPSRGISSQNNLNQEIPNKGQGPSKAPNAPGQSILNQRIPSQNIPSQSGATQNMPDQSISSQGFPNQGTKVQSIPHQGTLIQNNLNQGIPSQSQGTSIQNLPDVNIPNKDIPDQNMLNQGIPIQANQGQSGVNQDIPNKSTGVIPNLSSPNVPNYQNSQSPSNSFQNQNNQGFAKPHSIVDDIKVENNMILVPNNPPIAIKDKYPGMQDGLPNGITAGDLSDILYKFNYTIGFHGHYEMGWRNGTKIGGYFVNGRDGISRVVTYIADEMGYRPKVRLINLGFESPLTPKEETEKSFGLQNFEFVWYPLR